MPVLVELWVKMDICADILDTIIINSINSIIINCPPINVKCKFYGFYDFLYHKSKCMRHVSFTEANNRYIYSLSLSSCHKPIPDNFSVHTTQ